MKKILLITAYLLASNCFAQSKINLKLKAQLDSILQTDQGIREFFDTETSEARKDTIAQFFHRPKNKMNWRMTDSIDAANITAVEKIIAQYGYPGKTLVGEPANTAVFYSVQHSGKIEKYYPLIEEAALKGELPRKYAAMMLDRKRTNEHKEQVYGTQVHMQMITNAQTGKKEAFEFVVPIEDAANVNKRRKKAGFEDTVEEHAKKLNVVYKAYTWEQIDAIIKPKGK